MKVVFVCTGNTCRSPMAEAMWRYLMKDVTDDSHTVHSAGLAPAIGMPAAPLAVAELSRREIPFSGHTAKALTWDMLQNSDAVVVMTQSQRDLLRRSFGELEKKIQTLGEWSGLGGEIPDPFGGDASLYAQCASSIWEHLAAAKQRLYPEHGDTK